MSRNRRTAAEIRRLREYFFRIVTKEGPITLSQLMASHAGEMGINDTPSGKNLVKRQLSLLAEANQIEFRRQSRDLLAGPLRARLARRLASPPPSSQPEKASPPGQQVGQLEALRAYAQTLESFSKTLQNQVSVLVKMVEKLAG